jgi:steroid delta-isomerase-like uncharacterized protein
MLATFQKGAQMSEQNKAAVRRLIEDHWNGKNAAHVSELFTPNTVLHTPDGALTGLEGAAFLLHAYATAFPDFQMTIDDMIAEGNQVVVRWTFTGTHQGPLLSIPATGNRFNVPGGIGIFRLNAGKVEEGYFAWDKFALLSQLGVLPVPGGVSAQASS